MSIPSQPTLASSSTRRSKTRSKPSKAPSSGRTVTPPANQQAPGGTGGPADDSDSEDDVPLSVAVRKYMEGRHKGPASRKTPVSPEGTAEPSPPPPSPKIPSAATSDNDDLPPAVATKKRKRTASVSHSVNLAGNDAYFFFNLGVRW